MLLANHAIDKGFYRSKVVDKDGYYPVYSTILGNKYVSCEVYGKTAIIYIDFMAGQKNKIIDVCARNDIEYNVRESEHDIEITVHYFKGWHHWE